MGGHGGLNILPQKRWHVYRDDNRLRVLRDEREFQETIEAERQRQQRRVMSDVVTRFKRRKYGVALDSSGPPQNLQEGPEAGPSAAAEFAPAEQQMGGIERVALEESNEAAGPKLIAECGRQRTEQGTPIPAALSAARDQRAHSSLKVSSSADSTGRHPLTAQSSNPSSGRFSKDTPLMVRPLSFKTGRTDPLGRQQDGHFNFFAAAESEVAKQHKARERYLLQAGHSTSRQSEFSGIARELKKIWYQSEMPSNRIAREEKEDRLVQVRKCDRIEGAAEEAGSRMLATCQQRAGGDIPSTSYAATLKRNQHKADLVPSDSNSSDSDVCIVKECLVGARNTGDSGKRQKAKKAVSKSDSTCSSSRERRLLKRMKRKWMLEALDLQTKIQGSSKRDQTS